ncbi:MAG: siphovirus Gp157 family protein [Opitutia bacterium]
MQELADESSALDALVAMDEGEWTDEHEALALELTEKLLAKSDRFGDYVAHRETMADLLRKEEKRLAERRRRFEAEVSRLKGYALICMQRMDRPKLVGARHTIEVRKNPPAVQVAAPDEFLYDDSALARGFVVIEEHRTIDKKKIAEALKLGEVVPGCELTQGVRVDIR